MADMIFNNKLKAMNGVDFNGTQASNLVIGNVTALPTTGLKAGQVVYLTAKDGSYEIGLYKCDGTSWGMLATGGDVSGLTTRVGALETTVGDSTAGLVKDVTDLGTNKVTKVASGTGEAKLYANIGGTEQMVKITQDFSGGAIGANEVLGSQEAYAFIAGNFVGNLSSASVADGKTAMYSASNSGGTVTNNKVDLLKGSIVGQTGEDVVPSVSAVVAGLETKLAKAETDAAKQGTKQLRSVTYAATTGAATDDFTELTAALTETTAGKALDATAGKALNDRIDNLHSLGRYLSTWNCATGKPTTDPKVTPYTYVTGDYYIVATTAATNYKPNGPTYDKTASTTPAESNVEEGDFYLYDGTSWTLFKNHATTSVSDVQINGTTILSAGVANIVPESALSDTSEGIVQNKVVKAALDAKLAKNADIAAATDFRIVKYDAKGLVTESAEPVKLRSKDITVAAGGSVDITDGIPTGALAAGVMTVDASGNQVFNGIQVTAGKITVTSSVSFTGKLLYVC